MTRFSAGGFSDQCCFDGSSTAFVLLLGLSEDFHLWFVVKTSFHSLSGKPCHVMTICSYEQLTTVDKCSYLGWIIFRGLVRVLSKVWKLAQTITAIDRPKYITPILTSLFGIFIRQRFTNTKIYMSFKAVTEAMALKYLNSIFCMTSPHDYFLLFILQ